ncbi:GntR family transcriptional regulator [Oceanispirochaeta crateris]|uniref:GntR family transcriptional regulator n=1 Tax=Oceanispirochaeta crateris TaxID=2518645 RepID=A0A5C1QQW0_9SPIO|nr:GntR family transcriptional regulator [Oceanispirochaeta crateris]QEN08512.1 GntR family transcriptional regulator [Oceanispirochaeta crateris]
MEQLITRKNLSDQVHDHIKRMILSGELKGGERVPEASLSKLFGVSRTPLREALKKLSDYGLIYLKPRSYAEVVIIDEEEAMQIAEVRLYIEILSAKLFSKNASAKDFQEIRLISDKCLELNISGDKAAAFEMDSQFHLMIAKYCGNRCLYEIFEKLDARIQLVRLNQKLNTPLLTDYIKQHSILVAAMENKEENLIESILSSHIMHDFNKD